MSEEDHDNHHDNSSPYNDNASPHHDHAATADIHNAPTMKSVSCLCPTFARTGLLEEAIESFLRQDYEGDSELLVLNDFEGHTLHYQHPRVRVLNTPRYPTLGEKRNALAALAQGELLLTWGDDDIHLPHRISRMVSALGDDSMCMEGWHFCSYHAGEIALNKFATAGAHIITRDAYDKAGGIKPLSVGEDVAFNDSVRGLIGPVPVATENPAFFYRWSDTGRHHISGYGTDREGKPSAYARMLDYANALVLKGTERAGEVSLTPRWRSDYTAACAAAVSRT